MFDFGHYLSPPRNKGGGFDITNWKYQNKKLPDKTFNKSTKDCLPPKI